MNLKSIIKLAIVAGASKAILDAMGEKPGQDSAKRKHSRGAFDDFLQGAVRQFAEGKKQQAEEEFGRHKRSRHAPNYRHASEAEVSEFFSQRADMPNADWNELVGIFASRSRPKEIDAEWRTRAASYRFKELGRKLIAYVAASGDDAMKLAVVESGLNRVVIDGLPVAFERLNDIERSRREAASSARGAAYGSSSGGHPTHYRPVTAIGINISSHAMERDVPLDRPLAFEVSYYTDRAFPFSTTGHEELVNECADGYPYPWQGKGDADCSVEAIGIRPFIAFYQRLGDQPGEAELGAKLFLLEWWLYLRILEGLGRALGFRKAPRIVPVILGTHDFGPDAATVLYTTLRTL